MKYKLILNLPCEIINVVKLINVYTVTVLFRFAYVTVQTAGVLVFLVLFLQSFSVQDNKNLFTILN